jgi:tight adherence protein B
MVWLGFLMIFFSITLLIASLAMLMTSYRTKTQRRLEDITKEYNNTSLKEAVLEQNAAKQLNLIKNKQTGFIKKYIGELEKDLSRTDLLIKPQEYLTITAGFALILGLILYAVSHHVIMGLAGIILAVLISRMYVNIKKKRRTSKLEQQLVDTITLISNGLKAGYSFLQSSEMVAQEMNPPISAEFKRMIKQMNMGITTEEALKKLNERVDSQDMDLVITAILIQRQIGGNLEEVLDKIVDTIQGRIRLHRDIKAKTAQGRISGMILMFISPLLGLFIYTINPEFMGALCTNSLGWLMVGMAVLLEAIGIYALMKIINIDV